MILACHCSLIFLSARLPNDLKIVGINPPSCFYVRRKQGRGSLTLDMAYRLCVHINIY